MGPLFYLCAELGYEFTEITRALALNFHVKMMSDCDERQNGLSGEPVLTVDLEKVIREKNARLARLLPRFVVSWLKRKIHQDQVNDILTRFGGLESLEFVRATLDYMNIRYRAVGLENVPAGGRYLFVSNHPFGGLDGMMLAELLNRHFGPTKIIVNDVLMHLKPLAPLFIPVNKYGRQLSDYALTFREELAAPGHVATFPAGICSRRRKGVVSDLAWRPSFVKNAIEYRRDVVPIFFPGKLSDFFYNFASIREKLGVRSNPELFFLVDEMFRQSGQFFNIVCGKPVSWEQMVSGGTPAKWALRIRQMTYDLEKNIPPV